MSTVYTTLFNPLYIYKLITNLCYHESKPPSTSKYHKFQDSKNYLCITTDYSCYYFTSYLLGTKHKIIIG